MRVCFLTSSYPRFPEDPAGVFIHSLARSLVRQGCEVEVIAPRGNATSSFEIREGVHINRFPYFFRRYEKFAHAPGGIPPAIRNHPWLTLLLPFFFASFFAHALNHSRRVDVFHFHWLQNALLAFPLKFFSSRPTVATLWGTDVQWIESSRPLRVLTRTIASRMDSIVSVNDYFRTKLSSFGFSDNIRVIPNGVDLDRFGPADCVSLRAKAGLPSDAALVLYVGSLIERKGVRYLIEAMSHVARSNSGPVVLAIVGSGEERESLARAACSLGLERSVLFVGSIPPNEIPAWLRCADLFVLPSLYEGRPNVVLEALAAEVPVIATDIPGTREIVIHGQNGLLVPPRNSHALAEAITQLIKDRFKRERMGKAGRKMILQLGLTWDDIARQYLSLYQELGKSLRQNNSTMAND